MKKTFINNTAPGLRAAILMTGIAVVASGLASCGTSNGGGGGSLEPYNPPPSSAPRGSH